MTVEEATSVDELGTYTFVASSHLLYITAQPHQQFELLLKN
jgi:hypothetical protein